MDRIVSKELVDEGVKPFADSYESLLDTLEAKARELQPAAR